MAFMEIQVARFKAYRVTDQNGETHTVPADLVGDEPSAKDFDDYTHGADTWRVKTGWWARLSAPGYMDCTEWDGPHSTASKAAKELCEMFDICPACEESCWDSGSPCSDKDVAEAIAGWDA